MSKKIAFTQARIRDLPLPKIGRVEYRDTEINALSCRVSAGGNKSFILVKRLGSKMKRITLGKFPILTVTVARKKARAVLAEIDRGIDPIEVKRKEKINQTTLAQVLDQYLANRELKPYTIGDYRYKLKQGFSDWLDSPISNISEDMVLKRHKKISETGATSANNTMRVLRLTLNYAVAIGMVKSSPAIVMSTARLWNKNKRKSRVIPSNQLKQWREAVEALSNQKAKVYLLMALYMGFRSSELLTLEWSHVDMNDKSITLYDTKNGTNHRLPIPVPLLPFLTELNDITGGGRWVFAGRVVDSDKPMNQPRAAMKEVTAATGIEFSPHDCRRTFATIAEAVGLPLSMIKRLLNHVTTSDVTGGYIVTEDQTLRLAINSIADYINNA